MPGLGVYQKTWTHALRWNTIVGNTHLYVALSKLDIEKVYVADPKEKVKTILALLLLIDFGKVQTLIGYQ